MATALRRRGHSSSVNCSGDVATCHRVCVLLQSQATYLHCASRVCWPKDGWRSYSIIIVALLTNRELRTSTPRETCHWFPWKRASSLETLPPWGPGLDRSGGGGVGLDRSGGGGVGLEWEGVGLE